MRPKSQACAVALLIVAGVVPSQSGSVPSFVAKRFEQTKIADCVSAASPVIWRNTQFTYSEGGLAIAGADALGNTWKTVVPAGGVKKCEIWSAHIGQRQDSLIILNYGMDSSGYDSELTVLSFGDDGKPIPWRAVGGFDSSDRGVTQLVQMSGAGTAGIVVPVRVGNRWDGYAYRQDLYRISDAGIARVTGSVAGVSWPVASGNKQLLSGAVSSSLQVDMVAGPVPNAGPTIRRVAAPAPPASGITETLTDFSRLGVTPAAEPSGTILHFSDGTQSRLPYIVVADSPTEGRTIFFDQYVPDGIEQLVKGAYYTKALGQMCEEELCRPFVLWGSGVMSPK